MLFEATEFWNGYFMQHYILIQQANYVYVKKKCKKKSRAE